MRDSSGLGQPGRQARHQQPAPGPLARAKSPHFPGRLGGARSRPGPPGSRPTRLAQFAELHDAYVAEVELPGVSKNQMRIELADSTQHDSASGRRRARRAARVECRPALPARADAGQVMAALADGVLIVTVPRQDSEREPAGAPARPPQPSLIVYPEA